MKYQQMEKSKDSIFNPGGEKKRTWFGDRGFWCVHDWTVLTADIRLPCNEVYDVQGNIFGWNGNTRIFADVCISCACGGSVWCLFQQKWHRQSRMFIVGRFQIIAFCNVMVLSRQGSQWAVLRLCFQLLSKPSGGCAVRELEGPNLPM